MSAAGTRGGAAAPAARRQPGGPPKGDRRRQAILDAVEQLLRERTIAELAVEDIAAAAGISRSGFYFYFQSKYAALAETLAEVAGRMARASDEFFGGSDEAPEAYLPRSLRGVAELWRQHETLMCAIVDASHSDPGARELWEAWNAGFVRAIAARIEAERTAGRAAAGPDASGVARALLHMNLAVFYDDASRSATPDETERTVEVLTAVWLAAVWGRAAG